MEERFHTFTVLIGNINRAIHKIKTEEMAEFNLKSSHVSCLYYLYKGDAMTAKTLCEVCGEDKANISRSIKYLETNGYLVYCAQENRRRQCVLALTDTGRIVGARIVEKVDHILDLLGDGISEEHRKIMYQALSVVNQNMQNLCCAYGTSTKTVESGELQ